MIRFVFKLFFGIVNVIWKLIWRLFWAMAALLLFFALSIFFMLGAYNRGLEGVSDTFATMGQYITQVANDQGLTVSTKETSHQEESDSNHSSGTRWNEAQARIYLDSALDASFREAYLTAIDNWNQTGVFTFILVENEEEADIVASQMDDGTTSAAGDAQSQTNVVTNRFVSVLVRLNSYYLQNPVYAYSTERIVHTAEHELGHAIGLDHNEGESVMQSAGSYLGIQSVDIEAVRSLYANSSN